MVVIIPGSHNDNVGVMDAVGEFDAVLVAVRLTPATAAAMHTRRTPRMDMLCCACLRWDALVEKVEEMSSRSTETGVARGRRGGWKRRSIA